VAAVAGSWPLAAQTRPRDPRLRPRSAPGWGAPHATNIRSENPHRIATIASGMARASAERKKGGGLSKTRGIHAIRRRPERRKL